MRDAARLSVIVPFYNVERYLEACLGSLVAQTRPIDEIVLVDDGSTDGSAALAEGFARAHRQIRTIRGPGRGAAGARNAGIDAVSGDYLAFVDADDWAEPRMYERLVALLETRGLDIAMCNARYHFEGRQPDRPLYTDDPPPGPMRGKEWLRAKLEAKSIFHACWMHLYRRSFIDRHALRFTEGLMHEDVTWTTRALLLAPLVGYDDTPLYIYRRQPRQYAPGALDERLAKVIDGAMIDAQLLEQMADRERDHDELLARGLRWQLVDGGLAVFHKIRQLSSAELRRAQWRKVLQAQFFPLLWRNAADFTQKRKIASRYVRARLSTR